MVDQALTGGEVFDLGGRRVCAVATPGHTAGTMCYLVEDEGILFTGDHIMGQGTVVVRSDEGGSMAQHVASPGDAAGHGRAGRWCRGMGR